MRIITNIVRVAKLFNQFGSLLIKTLLRIAGAQIGKNTYISFNSKIVGGKSIKIGNDCVIKSNVKIKTKNLVIGNNCIISENCYITGGDDFIIGDNTFIGKKVRINVSRSVEVGVDVGIGENSVIWTHGYFPPADEGYPINYAPVSIDDGAWISTNIIILPGVRIGKGVIIGAGSVVTKNVDDHYLIAGNPAKVIKHTSEFRNSKPFTEVISGILSQYDGFQLLDTKENYLEFRIKNNKLYVVDGSIAWFNPSLLLKNDYVFFKNVKDGHILRSNKFLWFDFTERQMTSKRSNEITSLINILRSHGIRLTRNYNIKH
jgi:maltose O-acetyltransferase